MARKLQVVVRELKLVDYQTLLEAYEQSIHHQEEQFLWKQYEIELQVIANQTWLVKHQQWIQGLQQQIATVQGREQHHVDDQNSLKYR